MDDREKLLPSSRFVQLDVTDERSVNNAIHSIYDEAGRIMY